MVGINSNAEESISLELAESLDSVGRIDIVTSSSRFSQTLNTGTATLVAPNKILTSAHVIDTDLDGEADVTDLSQYSFLLGDNLENPDQEIGISNVSLHQSWVAAEENRFKIIDGEEFGNARFDLAVLTLDTNITDVPLIPLYPNVAELGDHNSLFGQTATLVGYGKFGSPSASLVSDGLRRAARNIIDAVGNNLIRFDYDSTFSFAQETDTGINSPTFDGSVPAVVPVPASSPLPISLEGEIGAGDSGGPLLVSTDLNTEVIVGVAHGFVDPDAISIPIPGYGSVDVYTALNHPATLEFLDNEGLIDSDNIIASQTLVSDQSRLVNLPEQNILGSTHNSDLFSDNSLNLAPADSPNIYGEELSLSFSEDF